MTLAPRQMEGAEVRSVFVRSRRMLLLGFVSILGVSPCVSLGLVLVPLQVCAVCVLECGGHATHAATRSRRRSRVRARAAVRRGRRGVS